MSEREPLASVEAVRTELKRLGYLDSGLDRFVLAGAGAASPTAACARVALRVGPAAGTLLATILTIAALLIDPRLLTDPLDLTVLVLYLLAAVSIVTALTVFLAGMVAAWWGRRAHRHPSPALSRNIGLAVGVLALGYGALWWRSHVAHTALWTQALVLVATISLSLILGRFGMLAAIAVLSAGGVGDRVPQARLARHGIIPLMLLAALILGAGVTTVTLRRGESAEAAPDCAIVPTGLHVRVLGIDGLESSMAGRMLSEGRMPHLKALLAHSARAPLTVEPQQVPAIVWTTIATGRGPEVHGILATGSRRLPGMRRPLPIEPGPFSSALTQATDLLRLTRRQPPTSVLRGAKTFWNVASEKGLRVGVLNWWATWPAEEVNGYIVTDRAFFKVGHNEPSDRDAYPPDLFSQLRGPLPSLPATKQASPPEEEPSAARAIDQFYLQASLLLREGSRPAIEAVYLPGLDILTMLKLLEPEPRGLAELHARLEDIEAYHELVDSLIEAWMRSQKDDEVLVLIADPGRFARRTTEQPQGLLICAGRDIKPQSLPPATERDILPTLMHLVGLPVSRELDGRVIVQAFADEFRAAHPVRFVAGYGRRVTPRSAESRSDPEIVERLRSLGYIQ
jgi:hypothetical protein